MGTRRRIFLTVFFHFLCHFFSMLYTSFCLFSLKKIQCLIILYSFFFFSIFLLTLNIKSSFHLPVFLLYKFHSNQARETKSFLQKPCITPKKNPNFSIKVTRIVGVYMIQIFVKAQVVTHSEFGWSFFHTTFSYMTFKVFIYFGWSSTL